MTEDSEKAVFSGLGTSLPPSSRAVPALASDSTAVSHATIDPGDLSSSTSALLPPAVIDASDTAPSSSHPLDSLIRPRHHRLLSIEKQMNDGGSGGAEQKHTTAAAPSIPQHAGPTYFSPPTTILNKAHPSPLQPPSAHPARSLLLSATCQQPTRSLFFRSTDRSSISNQASTQPNSNDVTPQVSSQIGHRRLRRRHVPGVTSAGTPQMIGMNGTLSLPGSGTIVLDNESWLHSGRSSPTDSIPLSEAVWDEYDDLTGGDETLQAKYDEDDSSNPVSGSHAHDPSTSAFDFIRENELDEELSHTLIARLLDAASQKLSYLLESMSQYLMTGCVIFSLFSEPIRLAFLSKRFDSLFLLLNIIVLVLFIIEAVVCWCFCMWSTDSYTPQLPGQLTATTPTIRKRTTSPAQSISPTLGKSEETSDTSSVACVDREEQEAILKATWTQLWPPSVSAVSLHQLTAYYSILRAFVFSHPIVVYVRSLFLSNFSLELVMESLSIVSLFFELLNISHWITLTKLEKDVLTICKAGFLIRFIAIVRTIPIESFGVYKQASELVDLYHANRELGWLNFANQLMGWSAKELINKFHMHLITATGALTATDGSIQPSPSPYLSSSSSSSSSTAGPDVRSPTSNVGMEWNLHDLMVSPGSTSDRSSPFSMSSGVPSSIVSPSLANSPTATASTATSRANSTEIVPESPQQRNLVPISSTPATTFSNVGTPVLSAPTATAEPFNPSFLLQAALRDPSASPIPPGGIHRPGRPHFASLGATFVPDFHSPTSTPSGDSDNQSPGSKQLPAGSVSQKLTGMTGEHSSKMPFTPQVNHILASHNANTLAHHRSPMLLQRSIARTASASPTEPVISAFGVAVFASNPSSNSSTPTSASLKRAQTTATPVYLPATASANKIISLTAMSPLTHRRVLSNDRVGNPLHASSRATTFSNSSALGSPGVSPLVTPAFSTRRMIASPAPDQSSISGLDTSTNSASSASTALGLSLPSSSTTSPALSLLQLAGQKLISPQPSPAAHPTLVNRAISLSSMSPMVTGRNLLLKSQRQMKPQPSQLQQATDAASQPQAPSPLAHSISSGSGSHSTPSSTLSSTHSLSSSGSNVGSVNSAASTPSTVHASPLSRIRSLSGLHHHSPILSSRAISGIAALKEQQQQQQQSHQEPSGTHLPQASPPDFVSPTLPATNQPPATSPASNQSASNLTPPSLHAMPSPAVSSLQIPRIIGLSKSASNSPRNNTAGALPRSLLKATTPNLSALPSKPTGPSPKESNLSNQLFSQLEALQQQQQSQIQQAQLEEIEPSPPGPDVEPSPEIQQKFSHASHIGQLLSDYMAHRVVIGLLLMVFIWHITNPLPIDPRPQMGLFRIEQQFLKYPAAVASVANHTTGAILPAVLTSLVKHYNSTWQSQLLFLRVGSFTLRNDSELFESYRTEELLHIKTDNCESWLDMSGYSQMNARFDFYTMIWLVLTLPVLLKVITVDVHTVVTPIERMVSFVMNLARDPLSRLPPVSMQKMNQGSRPLANIAQPMAPTISTGGPSDEIAVDPTLIVDVSRELTFAQQHQQSLLPMFHPLTATNPAAAAAAASGMVGPASSNLSPFFDQPTLASSFVELTLQKLALLLQVGFGTAGGEIIAQNIIGDLLDPMIPGVKVVAIFGFCDIADFNKCTEAFEETIMSFVNHIANIVHDTCQHFGGSVNKNIGSSFLLVWKFEVGDMKALKQATHIQNTNARRRKLSMSVNNSTRGVQLGSFSNSSSATNTPLLTPASRRMDVEGLSLPPTAPSFFKPIGVEGPAASTGLTTRERSYSMRGVGFGTPARGGNPLVRPVFMTPRVEGTFNFEPSPPLAKGALMRSSSMLEPSVSPPSKLFDISKDRTNDRTSSAAVPSLSAFNSNSPIILPSPLTLENLKNHENDIDRSFSSFDESSGLANDFNDFTLPSQAGLRSAGKSSSRSLTSRRLSIGARSFSAADPKEPAPLELDVTDSNSSSGDSTQLFPQPQPQPPLLRTASADDGRSFFRPSPWLLPDERRRLSAASIGEGELILPDITPFSVDTPSNRFTTLTTETETSRASSPLQINSNVSSYDPSKITSPTNASLPTASPGSLLAANSALSRLFKLDSDAMRHPVSRITVGAAAVSTPFNSGPMGSPTGMPGFTRSAARRASQSNFTPIEEGDISATPNSDGEFVNLPSGSPQSFEKLVLKSFPLDSLNDDLDNEKSDSENSVESAMKSAPPIDPSTPVVAFEPTVILPAVDEMLPQLQRALDDNVFPSRSSDGTEAPAPMHKEDSILQLTPAAPPLTTPATPNPSPVTAPPVELSTDFKLESVRKDETEAESHSVFSTPGKPTKSVSRREENAPQTIAVPLRHSSRLVAAQNQFREEFIKGLKQKQAAVKGGLKRSDSVNSVNSIASNASILPPQAQSPPIRTSVHRIAHQALSAFLATIVQVATDASISRWKFRATAGKSESTASSNPALMGFGLHVGWAIEGAIGSSHKIDASYLSPNVNLAARLCSASRQYKVSLLFSGAFYKLLDVPVQKRCRHLDQVMVKGSGQPIDIYTFDISPGWMVATAFPTHTASVAGLKEAAAAAKRIAQMLVSNLATASGDSGAKSTTTGPSATKTSMHGELPNYGQLRSEWMHQAASLNCKIPPRKPSSASATQAAAAAATAAAANVPGSRTTSQETDNKPTETGIEMLPASRQSSTASNVNSTAEPAATTTSPGKTTNGAAENKDGLSATDIAHARLLNQLHTLLSMLQVGLPSNYVSLFNRGVRCYLSGDWQQAGFHLVQFQSLHRDVVEKAKKQHEMLQASLQNDSNTRSLPVSLNAHAMFDPVDGPSALLLQLMGRHAFRAPSDWKGWRKLEKK